MTVTQEMTSKKTTSYCERKSSAENSTATVTWVAMKRSLTQLYKVTIVNVPCKLHQKLSNIFP